MESAWPRMIAASCAVSLRAGSGRRALFPARPGRSAAKVTSTSRFFAMARKAPVSARLKGSVGDSLPAEVLGLMLEAMARKISVVIPGDAQARARNDELYDNATFTELSGS